MGRRVVWVDTAFLAEMMKKRSNSQEFELYHIENNPLPEDARVVSPGVLALVIESDEWGGVEVEISAPKIGVKRYVDVTNPKQGSLGGDPSEAGGDRSPDDGPDGLRAGHDGEEVPGG